MRMGQIGPRINVPSKNSSIASVLLVWHAFSKTLWLLLLAVPVLVTGLVLAVAFHRNPDLGLRFEWPLRRRWVRPNKPKEKHPSEKGRRPRVGGR